MPRDQFDEIDASLERSMPIGNRLTLEEVEIALTFLRRRFPSIKIEKLISTLDNYHQRKSYRAAPKRSGPQSQNASTQRLISFPLKRARREANQVNNQLRQMQQIEQAAKDEEGPSMDLIGAGEEDINSTQQSIHYLIP